MSSVAERRRNKLCLLGHGRGGMDVTYVYVPGEDLVLSLEGWLLFLYAS